MERRTFMTATATTAASAAATSFGGHPSVGTADVIRLRQDLDQLVSIDHRRGGHTALESAAATGARRALSLQQRSATQRTRQRLYSLTADFLTTAAFSSIDSTRFDSAQIYLDRAGTFARLSHDSMVEFRVWNMASMLAHYRGRPDEAVAMAHMARSTSVSRHDPLFASLGNARAAMGHARGLNRQAALRSLGQARELLDKAADTARPNWMAFYGLGEIQCLTALVHLALGQPELAESSAHHALSATQSPFRRNRAQISIYLARAQLDQFDPEQACATAQQALDLMADGPIPGRLRAELRDFHKSLIAMAPADSFTVHWTRRARQEWTTHT